jgi:hypothetical protein
MLAGVGAGVGAGVSAGLNMSAGVSAGLQAGARNVGSGIADKVASGFGGLGSLVGMGKSLADGKLGQGADISSAASREIKERANKLGVKRGVLSFQDAGGKASKSSHAICFRLNQVVPDTAESVDIDFDSDTGGSQQLLDTMDVLYKSMLTFDPRTHGVTTVEAENAELLPPECPGLVLSVCGNNSMAPSLRPLFMETFGKDLKHLCELTGAWVTTSGTDDGVCSLVGDVRQQFDIKSPFIGFVSGGAPFMTHKQLLPMDDTEDVQVWRYKKADGSRVDGDINEHLDEDDARWEPGATVYPPPSLDFGSENDGVAKTEDVKKHVSAMYDSVGHETKLNNNHSHFIIVDRADEGNEEDPMKLKASEFGAEIDTKDLFETYVSSLQFIKSKMCANMEESLHIPRVLLVWGGGYGEMDTVYKACKQSVPIILVVNSGRYVEVLRAYLKVKQDTKQESFSESYLNRQWANADMLLRTLLASYFEDDDELEDAFMERKSMTLEVIDAHINLDNKIYMYDISPGDANEGIVNTESSSYSMERGELFSIAKDVLMNSIKLTMRAKMMLSIKWDSDETLKEQFESMPLDSNSLDLKRFSHVKLVYRGEAVTYAADMDKRKMLDILYDNGVGNDFLDVLIMTEMGFRFKGKRLEGGGQGNDHERLDNIYQKYGGKTSSAGSSSKYKVGAATIGITNSSVEGADGEEVQSVVLIKDFDKSRKSGEMSKAETMKLSDGILQESERESDIGWDILFHIFDNHKNTDPVVLEKRRTDPKYTEESEKDPTVLEKERRYIRETFVLKRSSDKLHEDIENYPENILDSYEAAFAMQAAENLKRTEALHARQFLNKADNSLGTSFEEKHEHTSDCSLTWMHRAYWAMLTNRHDIAKVFTERCDARIATCMLMSWCYRQRADGDNIMGDTYEELAVEYDAMLMEFIEEDAEDDEEKLMEYLGTHLFNQNGMTASESFLAERVEKEYGEQFLNWQTLQKYRTTMNVWKETWASSNSYEAAFRLFGPLEGPYTIVDLALHTGNKNFTGHDRIQKFLDTLWSVKCEQPDQFEERRSSKLLRLAVTTKDKLHVLTGAYLVFMVGYTWFLLTLTNSQCNMHNILNEAPEWIFWSFVIGFVWDEFQVMYYKGLKQYYKGAHNYTDSALVLIFTVAFCIRVYLNIQVVGSGKFTEKEWEVTEGCQFSNWTQLSDDYAAEDGGAARRFLAKTGAGSSDEGDGEEEDYTCPNCAYLETDETQRFLSDISKIMLGFGYLINSLRVLEVLSINESVGILIIMLKKMVIQDCYPYFSITVIFNFMLGTSFFGMFGGSIGFGNWQGKLLEMFFVGADWENFSKGVKFAKDEDNFLQPDAGLMDSLSYSIGTLGFYFFVVTTQIILVNLLIAQMGDTYGTIKEDSSTEWKFVRTGLIKESYAADLMPPPFNLINSFGAGIVDLIKLFSGNCIQGDTGRPLLTKGLSLVAWGKPYNGN